MPHTSPSSREKVFRVRFFGNPDLPLFVRLFGLYLAVPVTVVLGVGSFVGLYFSKISRIPSQIWLMVVGFSMLSVCALGVYQTGRALMAGRRWAVWATMVLCLLAGLTTTGIFNERERWGGQAGSAVFFAVAMPALVAFIVSLRNLAAFQPLDGTAARRARFALKWGIPATILLLVVGYSGLNILVARYERSVNARWAAHGINPDEIPTRFPRTEANQTARMLANMAATDSTCQRMGTYGFSKLVDLKSPDAKALGFVEFQQPPFKQGWAILEELQKKPGDDVGEMPADVTDYLEKHHSVLDRMYAAIRAQSPQWEMDVARGSNGPVPDFMESRAIVNLICLDALNHLRKGEKEQALAELDCAWRIASACSARPEMTSQVMGLVNTQTIFLTLRKFNGVSPEWHERLSVKDRMNRFRVSLACEAYNLSADAKRFGVSGLDMVARDTARFPLWKRILLSFSRPLARYWAAEISESYLSALERIEAREGCAFDGNPFQTLQSPMNPANELSLSARTPLSGLYRLNDYWQWWMKSQFSLEMTDKLLKVKEAANGGVLTDDLPGMESSICPESWWELEVYGGSFSLTFSKKPWLFDTTGTFNKEEREKLFKIEWASWSFTPSATGRRSS